MIYLYTGTPGSGKSLHLAKQIRDLLTFGYPVISNIAIKTNLIRRRRGQYVFLENEDITPEFLKYYSQQYFAGRKTKEGQITLIFDESQMVFNARDWNKPDRRAWLNFFTVHRHYGYDILLVAQYDDMLDKQVRALVEYQCVHRKVKNMGWRGKLVNTFAGGNLFSSTTIWYPMRDPCGLKFIKARKRYYGLYDTFADFETTEAVQLTAELKKAIKTYEQHVTDTKRIEEKPKELEVIEEKPEEDEAAGVAAPNAAGTDARADAQGAGVSALGAAARMLKGIAESICNTKVYLYIAIVIGALAIMTISYNVTAWFFD